MFNKKLMKRNKAKTKNDFMRKYATIAKKRKRKLRSEQAKRMRNGSLFASFRFEAKKKYKRKSNTLAATQMDIFQNNTK
jgi:hypothetical protein